MHPTARQPKGNPTLTAALKTLKRLQEKHNGVVEASDFKDDEQRAVLVDTGFLRPVMKGKCRVKAEMALARLPSNPMASLLLVAIAQAMTPRRA